jgi:hypothetical protein
MRQLVRHSYKPGGGYKAIAQDAINNYIPKLKRALSRSRAECRRLRARLDRLEAERVA